MTILPVPTSRVSYVPSTGSVTVSPSIAPVATTFAGARLAAVLPSYTLLTASAEHRRQHRRDPVQAAVAAAEHRRDAVARVVLLEVGDETAAGVGARVGRIDAPDARARHHRRRAGGVDEVAAGAQRQRRARSQLLVLMSGAASVMSAPLPETTTSGLAKAKPVSIVVAPAVAPPSVSVLAAAPAQVAEHGVAQASVPAAALPTPSVVPLGVGPDGQVGDAVDRVRRAQADAVGEQRDVRRCRWSAACWRR